MKRLVPLIIIAAIAYLIYTKSPLARDTVDGAVAKWTEWSPENIKKDPEGFLKKAESQITKTLSGLEESKSEMAKNIKDLRTKHAANTEKVETANEFAEKCKVAYKAAKAEGGTWPVEVAGNPYTETKLLEQVQSLMAERDTLNKVIASQENMISKAEESQSGLNAQVTKLKGELDMIETRKAELKTEKLTAEANEWLDKINKQVADSNNLVTESETSVKTIEDLVNDKAAQVEKEAKAAADAAKVKAAEDFLNS